MHGTDSVVCLLTTINSSVGSGRYFILVSYSAISVSKVRKGGSLFFFYSLGIKNSEVDLGVYSPYPSVLLELMPSDCKIHCMSTAAVLSPEYILILSFF